MAVFLLGQSRLWTASASLGRELFVILTWGGFAFCLFSGVLFASGLLCQERRDGSLALLFLTRLTGLDVVLGKLTAILLLAGQVILGLFPILALCIPLGGVSIGEFWRAAVTLLATLVLSLATGLFVSSLNRDLSRSVLVAFAAITIPTALIGFFDALLRDLFPGTTVGGVLPGLWPLMTSILAERYSATPAAFEFSLASQFLLAAGLLLLAGRMLKRHSISGAPASGWLARLIHSRCAMQPRERRQLLRHNPVYWLGQRQRWRWLATWTCFCLLIVLWVLAFEYFQFVPGALAFTIFVVAPLLHLLLKIAMVAECASRLSVARDGELELLLATPLTTGQIIRGQQRGLLRQFLWPIITILAVDLIFTLTYGTRNPYWNQDSIVASLFIYTLGVSMIIDAPALVVVGLWEGLRWEKNIHALQRTLLKVVGLPLVIYLFTAPLLALVVMTGRPTLAFLGFSDHSDPTFLAIALILLWCLTSFVTTTLLQRNAKFRLKRFLRFIAADPRAARAILNSSLRRGPPPISFGRFSRRLMPVIATRDGVIRA